MSIQRDIAIAIQRMTWRDGQALTSRDMRDDRNYCDRLRQLHVHYLHKTWGVVEGLRVVASGNSAVAVSPGYALDIDGRELLVPIDTKVVVPALSVSTTIYLVLSRSGTSLDCVNEPDLALLCPGVSSPVPIEAGALTWKTVTEVRPGHDVLLARLLIAGGKLASAVDMSVQRRAATMAQPRIRSDVTQQGQTGWSNVSKEPLPEIEATVDTAEAGFTARPAYFASLVGASGVAAGFIASAHPASFSFVVRLYDGSNSTLSAAQAESNGWTIAWLAVELP